MTNRINSDKKEATDLENVVVSISITKTDRAMISLLLNTNRIS